MKNLKSLFLKHWRSDILITAASFIGFVDSTYLTATWYMDGIPPCRLVSGCEQVLTSSYAVIWGMPKSLLGVGFYALILVLISLYRTKSSEKKINIIRFFAVLGLATSVYFIYLQAFVIEAWCLYCLVSAAATLIIFWGSLGLNQ